MASKKKEWFLIQDSIDELNNILDDIFEWKKSLEKSIQKLHDKQSILNLEDK